MVVCRPIFGKGASLQPMAKRQLSMEWCFRRNLRGGANRQEEVACTAGWQDQALEGEWRSVSPYASARSGLVLVGLSGLRLNPRTNQPWYGRERKSIMAQPRRVVRKNMRLRQDLLDRARRILCTRTEAGCGTNTESLSG
jgi:hypothetical protein